jgi:hypothetical protein
MGKWRQLQYSINHPRQSKRPKTKLLRRARAGPRPRVELPARNPRFFVIPPVFFQARRSRRPSAGVVCAVKVGGGDLTPQVAPVDDLDPVRRAAGHHGRVRGVGPR